MLLAANAAPAAPDVRFDDRARDRVTITTPAYRVSFAKANGRLRELVDRKARATVVHGAGGCIWTALVRIDRRVRGGCAYARGGANRFAYRWSPAARTLTLTYTAAAGASRRIDASAVVAFGATSFDLRLTLANRSGATIAKVAFPDALVTRTADVRAGYAPHYLPGVRFSRGFFTRRGSTSVQTYPSRWAFADWLALDVGGGTVALSAVNPAPAPIQPVELGFVHDASGTCGGPSFCTEHVLQTWIPPAATWRSPRIRVRVGQGVRAAIDGYRRDNRIDAYPPLPAKVDAATLARAVLVKADLHQGLRPFREWADDLRRLPSPSLVHPVSFQPRGHDESFPDFLPPDPEWGTTGELRDLVELARSLGHRVMPYLNVSWWDDESPTVRALPPPLALGDLAVHDHGGAPVVDRYADKTGYTVTPYHPFVRDRVHALLEQWRTEVPADCLFFDQIGARPWRPDFNPVSPTPIAYADGWVELMARYRDRCLMVEDGWDRLAASFAAFHGSVLMMAREHDEPDRRFGAGNWTPFPLAPWLLGDKVLLYHHDLYPGTMTADPEVIAFNAAFGFAASYAWDERTQTLDSPWLQVASAFQRVLGPRIAGRRPSFEGVADDVTTSTFGDVSVVTNWRDRGVTVDGFGLARHGFLARAQDGSLVAGAFVDSFAGTALSPGTHYIVVERNGDAVVVRQPLGATTPLSVQLPRAGAWRAEALGADGGSLGSVAGAVRGGRFEFEYGEGVAAYRIVAG